MTIYYFAIFLRERTAHPAAVKATAAVPTASVVDGGDDLIQVDRR